MNINTLTYYFIDVIIIIILCYQNGLIYHNHNIPFTVHSFQYDERYSIISSLHNSISRIRGGDDDEDRLDISRVSQSIIDTSNPLLTTDIDRIDIGKRKPSRGLWKRIRSIRGGVDDNDKSQDDTTLIDDSQEVESLESTSLKSKEDIDMSVDANISADDSTEEHAGKTTKEKKKQKKKTHSPQAKKEGGAFTSFISLFRADPSKTSQSNIKERPIGTDTSGIAHKIPHGPDGRGGGYATMTRPKQSSSAEEEEEDRDTEEAEEDEFIITTDISTSDATQDESTKPSSVGVRGNSAAFVVPPSPKTPTQTTTVDKSKDDKKSKASKSEPVVEEVDISSNSALNETESTLDSVSDTNTTGLDSSSNTTATVTDEISVNTTTLQKTDYTSSGYVSSICYITCDM